MRKYSRMFHETRLFLNKNYRRYGVITAGIATAYYQEILDELPEEPSHLAVGMYPLPADAIQKLADKVNELLVIEEGYPFIEEQLRSLADALIPIRGKMDGTLPDQGELNPDIICRLFFPEEAAAKDNNTPEWPLRNSQLCNGCPHKDTFNMISEVKAERDDLLVMADIGCYTLGALPPYSVLDAALCMGASIGMAHGAVDAGNRNVIAVIGDSSFYHSGFPGLFDAVADNTPMVILIVDNSTTAMTGGQDTVLPAERLGQLVRAAGVIKEHVREVVPLPGNHRNNVAILRDELAFNGVSVIISRRECVQLHRRKNRKESYHDH